MKEECPESVVACTFAEVGCEMKVKRKVLLQHIQEAMADHMTAMFDELVKVKQENARLATEVNRLRSRGK